MIHVVTKPARGLYPRQLLEMHQLRAKLFVERRGWKALTVREDGGEYDQYDDDQTVYLMSLLPGGEVGVTQRLRPARDRSMIHDLFPHLLAPGETAIGPDVCEGSRHFLSPAFRKAGDRRPMHELTVATMETAVAMGARRMVAIVDVFAIQNMIDLCWPVRWLGLPAAYAEGECIACEVETTPATVAAARERLGLDVVRRLELPAETPASELAALLDGARRLDRETVRSLTRIIEATVSTEVVHGEEAALAFLELVEQRVRSEALVH